MCGVLLYINKKTGVNLHRFNEALDMQSHRGPDDRGVFYLDKLDSRSFREFKPNHNHQLQPCLAIGHRRLSILDLTQSSRQPMVNSAKQFLVYNGEFYNYKDFARSIVKKDFFNERILDNRYFFRSLFSIALLDSKYPLSL